MPESESFFMLMNSRKKAPWFPDTIRQYIRCLRTDGSVAWQYDLSESSASELAFVDHGRVIAFGDKEVGQYPQSKSRQYDNELFLFDTDGRLISHIKRRGPFKLDRSWLLTYEPNYLYMISDMVEVLDLQSGCMLTQVPLRPLYYELSKDGTYRSSGADRLIRRQLGLGLGDSIPPLE